MGLQVWPYNWSWVVILESSLSHRFCILADMDRLIPEKEATRQLLPLANARSIPLAFLACAETNSHTAANSKEHSAVFSAS